MNPAKAGVLTGTAAWNELYAWLKVPGELQPRQLLVSSTQKTYLEVAVLRFSLWLPTSISL